MVRKLLLVGSLILAVGIAALAIVSQWWYMATEFCPTDSAVSIVAVGTMNLLIFVEETADRTIIAAHRRWQETQFANGAPRIAVYRYVLRVSPPLFPHFRMKMYGQKIWGPVRQTQVWISLWYFVGAFLAYPFVRLVRATVRRRQLRRTGICGNCGYDLTGNMSGVCPECGRQANTSITPMNTLKEPPAGPIGVEASGRVGPQGRA